MVRKNVEEYVEKLAEIENEISLLREDKRALDMEYKELIDLKAVKAALRIIKVKANANTDLVETVLNILDASEPDSE
jgi:hypothetical protein